MKKKIKKLSLNKKTISNLNAEEMNKKVGGYWTLKCHGHTYNGCGTGNGNTCPGHNTCYNC